MWTFHEALRKNRYPQHLSPNVSYVKRYGAFSIGNTKFVYFGERHNIQFSHPYSTNLELKFWTWFFDARVSRPSTRLAPNKNIKPATDKNKLLKVYISVSFYLGVSLKRSSFLLLIFFSGSWPVGLYIRISLPRAIDRGINTLYEPDAVFSRFLGSLNLKFLSLFISLILLHVLPISCSSFFLFFFLSFFFFSLSLSFLFLPLSSFFFFFSDWLASVLRMRSDRYRVQYIRGSLSRVASVVVIFSRQD